MSTDDIRRFRSEMERKLKGEFTLKERERMSIAVESYRAIIKNNGGINPLFS